MRYIAILLMFGACIFASTPWSTSTRKLWANKEQVESLVIYYNGNLGGVDTCPNHKLEVFGECKEISMKTVNYDKIQIESITIAIAAKRIGIAYTLLNEGNNLGQTKVFDLSEAGLAELLAAMEPYTNAVAGENDIADLGKVKITAKEIAPEKLDKKEN